jgi:hypothetical protein
MVPSMYIGSSVIETYLVSRTGPPFWGMVVLFFGGGIFNDWRIQNDIYIYIDRLVL